MRVIKEGNKVKISMQVSCDVCKAELEIEAPDVQIFRKNSESYAPCTYYVVKCPCCSRYFEIPRNKFSDRFICDMQRFETPQSRLK